MTEADGQVVFEVRGDHSKLDFDLDDATSSIARKTAGWTAIANSAVNGIMNLAGKAASGFLDLAKNGIEYNATMQDYTTSFTTMLGSAEAAQQKVEELKVFAAKTPFAMSDLAGATQTLLSFGLSSEEASLHLQRLGDISQGDSQKLQSLTLAFAQVSSSGKLAGQDLLQMINAGFNPLQTIAEKTGVSIGDLKAVMSGDKTSDEFNFRMAEAQKEVAELGVNASEGAIMLTKIGEEGMISADMVAAAMRIATSEGGLFFNAMQNASETFNGQLSTLQDGLSTLSGNVFASLFDYLAVDVMPTANRWVSELNEAFEKDGWAGLKGAAGGIFDEISEMAVNTGAGILAGIYNGLTGDTKTAEDVKGFLGGLFDKATKAANDITAWWAVTEPQIKSAAEWTLKFTGFAPWTDADTEALRAWWDGVYGKIVDVCEWVIDLELPPIEESAKKLQAWYESVRLKASDKITPETEQYVADVNEVVKNVGLPAQSFVSNPDTFYNFTWVSSLVNALKTKSDSKNTDGLLRRVFQKLDNASSTLPDDFIGPPLPESFEPVILPVELDKLDIQSQLNSMGLIARVTAYITRVAHSSSLESDLKTPSFHDRVASTLTGQTHASGGIYTAATRLMGADGLHTVGESGAEAILPLDELWRRLGLSFDAAFAANLADLPLTVMPSIQAASAAQAAQQAATASGSGDPADYDRMAETIAERVAEAIKGIAIEVDRKKIAEIVSREIANETNKRRWTG